MQFLQDAPNLARSIEMADALIVLHGDSSLGVSERDTESEDRLSIHTHTHTHTQTHWVNALINTWRKTPCVMEETMLVWMPLSLMSCISLKVIVHPQFDNKIFWDATVLFESYDFSKISSLLVCQHMFRKMSSTSFGSIVPLDAGYIFFFVINLVYFYSFSDHLSLLQ